MFGAVYFDGKTATPHGVTIGLSDTHLEIRLADDRCVTWPMGAVRSVETATDASALHLRCGWERDDRLTVSDAEAMARLTATLPNLDRRDSPKQRHGRKVALWALATVASVVVLIVVIIPYLSAEIAERLPVTLTQKIGVAAKKQVLTVFSAMEDGGEPEDLFCRDPAVDKILAELTARLTSGLQRDAPLTIEVVDLKLANAMALPGGHILVFRGLLEEFEDGNAFTGVLAHEIAHAVFKHPMEVFIKNTGASVLIGFLFGDIAGGSILAGIGTILVGSVYSREAERNADRLAIDLMNRADWDISPLARFFDRIDEKQGTVEAYFAFVTTHPVSKERAVTLRAAARGTAAALTDEQWDRLKRVCAD